MDNILVEQDGFVDIWKTFHDKYEPSYDPDNNELLFNVRALAVRRDAILLRARVWHTSGVEYMGQADPASTHYGVLAKVTLES